MENNDYKIWLARAKSSLKISKTRTGVRDNEDISYEDLCFQAQQAVEKALKGF